MRNIPLPTNTVSMRRSDCNIILEHVRDALHLFLAIPTVGSLYEFMAIGGTRIIRVPRDELKNEASWRSAYNSSIELGKIMEKKVRALFVPQMYKGGKMTVLAPNDQTDIEKMNMLNGIAEFLNSLGGRFQTGIDSGLTYNDILTLSKLTQYVQDVDPSPETACGIFHSMRSFVQHFFPNRKVSVAIKGVGNVGYELVRCLLDSRLDRHSFVEEILVSDINQENIKRAEEYANDKGGIKILNNWEIHKSAELFAPCALGGSVTRSMCNTLHSAGVLAIAGSENGPYEPGVEKILQRMGIFCFPDFVINAGGVIKIMGALGIVDPKKEIQKIPEKMKVLYEAHERGSEMTPAEEFEKLMKS